MKTHISVVIPAHNEEKYIKRCMDSIHKADGVFPGNTEIIVVCNRCTDKTENIARANGAIVLLNEDRCIAKVRNTGIKGAKGRIIVTIDADNRMTKGTLREIYGLSSHILTVRWQKLEMQPVIIMNMKVMVNMAVVMVGVTINFQFNVL